MKRLALTLFLTFLVAGCSSYGWFRDWNRINIAKIEPGMTRAQVMQTMGEGSYRASDGPVSNPEKRETIKDAKGVEYEVLYYYTEQIGQKKWESGITPVVFSGDKVVGIGWKELEARRTVKKP
ncbi:MAG: DUF3192 domain-containing protein [Betaproteobacteria bacterium]|nr:DUF3192 domain-containing protein [Betaproteobacteria bacterium]